ncbi:MAG: HupE/UreJ family protein [Polaribacter sp.]
MDDFMLYIKMGLNHVLDFSAYDHILFLIVLAVVFKTKEWRKVLWLVTFFTIGHSLTLGLSAYGIVKVPVDVVEFLIPLTIFITAVVNVLHTKEIASISNSINLLFSGVFGLIHGLGFSNYFRLMIGQEEDKLMPLIEFALGIEIAQIVVVVSILLFGYLLKNVFRVTNRDWIIVTSSIVIGFAIQMMAERVFW